MHNETRDYRDFQKRKLSGSVDGRGIKLTTNGSPGTLIHTALDSVAANEWDEVFIQAANNSDKAARVRIEWGGTTDTDDHIEATIPPKAGLTEVIAGNILQNGAVIRAFGETANVIVLHGYVNRYQHI